jgi:hypothetical protein
LQYATKIEERRVQAQSELLALRWDLAAYDDFQWDSSLKDGFLNDLDVVLSVIDNEDKWLVALWIEISEIPNDERIDGLEASYTEKENNLLESANKKLQESGENLTRIQEAFAETHNFELALE